MKRFVMWVVLALMVSGPALAQTSAQWPQKPVKLVVPFAPGGNVDIAARAVAAPLQAMLGQPFVVENRPGAGGMIASDAVAGSPADGYTLFVGANGPLLFSHLIHGQANWKWDEHFAPIGSISFTPLLVLVNSTLPDVKSLSDLIETAKKREVFMGLAGSGSTNHLLSELMQSTTGAKWTTVLYKGNAPTLMALRGGEVNFSFDQISVALPHVKAGAMRAIAVSAPKRFPSLPDVPTFEEQGLKDFDAETFVGLFAPAKTPPEVVKRLNDALRTVLQDEKLVEQFRGLGSEARATTVEAFTQIVRREEARWTPVIRKADIKPAQ